MWLFLIDFFKKNLFTIVSVLADILVIAFIAYSAWNVFHPKPTTTQNQKAQTIYNYTFNVYPDTLKGAVGKIGGLELFSYHSRANTPITVTSSSASSIIDMSKIIKTIDSK